MAIADISFVCSKDNCPRGYDILLQCPTGHPANLWKKFIGAPAEERYLCITKNSSDGKILEDMYIPGSGERYVMKGFEVVKRTIEGEDSLNCKYLAIKRTTMNSAKTCVIDIAIYRAKDKPPQGYKKLGAKLNGLYICVKIVPIEDLPSTPAATNNVDPSKNKSTSQYPPSQSKPPPVENTSGSWGTSSSTSRPPPLGKASSSWSSQNTPEPTSGPAVTAASSYGTSSGSSGSSYGVPPPPTGSTSFVPPPQSTGPPPATVAGYSTGPSAGVQQSSYNPPSMNTSMHYPTPRVPMAGSFDQPGHYPTSHAPTAGSFDQPGHYPTSHAPMAGSFDQPGHPHISTASSIDQPENDPGGILLGFEHLDLDQPIEFDQQGEFEETPPDSPVNEHCTVEESFDVTTINPLESSNPYSGSESSNPYSESKSSGPHNAQPLPSGSYSQPPSSSPYTQPPYYSQPPPTGPYSRPPPSGPYSRPPPSGPYYQPPPTGPYSQPPPPMGSYPRPAPSGPYSQTQPYQQHPGPYSQRPPGFTGGYPQPYSQPSPYGGYPSAAAYPPQRQSYPNPNVPPAYNPSYSAQSTRPRPPPGGSSGYSTNIGFNF